MAGRDGFFFFVQALPHQGHSAKCWEFGILRKNFKNRTGFHQVRFHCLASLSGKIGNYRGWLASREKFGIIGIPIFPNNSQSGIIRNYQELSGIIGSEFWWSVLVIINHVFACLPNIAVLSRHHHQSLLSLIITSSFASCPWLWRSQGVQARLCVSSLASSE
jgi:hypothetical protein